jgi:hypothetical protein
MKIEITRIQNPTYRRTEWSSNADFILLLSGEIGFEIPDGDSYPTRMKVGPGYWKDLPYFEPGTFYPYSDPVTNPIGDATGSLLNKSIAEIIKLMVSPYTAPVIFNQRNNAGGTFNSNNVLEIGRTLTGTITVSYSVSTQDNLTGTTPIYAFNSVFSNSGWFSIGNIHLNLAAPLNPQSPSSYPIQLKAKHTKGETGFVTTNFSFVPRIVWGSSSLETITANDLNTLSGRLTRLTSTMIGDYRFNSTGYSWLAVPSMIVQQNVIFVDATYSELSAPYGLMDTGVTVTYNNGTGTYAYRLYRSVYPLNNTSTLRIKNA